MFTHVYVISILLSKSPESQKPCQPEAYPYSFLVAPRTSSLAPHPLINHYNTAQIHIILTFI